jgi:MFS family permease
VISVKVNQNFMSRENVVEPIRVLTSRKQLSNRLKQIPTMPWYRWIVYSVANIAFTVGVLLSAIGIVIPEIMRDFSIQADQMGKIISVYLYTYAIMQIPGGILADRIGPRKTVSMFLVVGGIGIIVFSQAPSFPLGFIGRFLTALGVGVLYVNQIKVLRGWFRPEEFATAMGVGSSINSIGGLIASPVLAVLVDQFGWRMTFLTIGNLNLVIAIVAWVIIRDKNPTWPEVPEWETDLNKKMGIVESILIILRNGQFLLLFFIALLTYGGILGVFFGWGLPFLMQGFRLTRLNAALYITGMSIFGLVSAPILGKLSDSKFKARKPILLIGVIGGLISVMLIALFASQLSLFTLGVVFGILGISTSALILAYTMANELFPSSISGVASAILNMGPYIGSGIYQYLAGIILGEVNDFAIDGTPLYTINDYQKIFFPSVIAGIIAVILTFIVRETMRKQSKTI